MTKPYNVIDVIGRFQGPHIPHFELFRRAGELSDMVVVTIGSIKQPRTHKNPWTFQERMTMIGPELIKLSADTGAKFIMEGTIDSLYDYDGWLARSQAVVAKHTKAGDRVGLLGHKKDAETSEYLGMFPQWDFIPVDPIQALDATQIREMYFSEKFNHNFLTGVMPQSVISYLLDFRKTSHFQYIMEGKAVVDKIRKSKEGRQFEEIAVTADAVVTQSGHILLIKRKSHPGKGLWALPGGYMNAKTYGPDSPMDMDPIDAIYRELREETQIDVPEKVLRGSTKEIRHFAHPNRSLLGRSITFAAHIALAGGEWKLPKVKGTDDAEKAKWFPFVDVKKEELFDDHYDIITQFVPLLNQ